jgi:hypothetical protein
MNADRQHVLEAWKTTVEVQRHFNDIAIRIRNLAVTVLAALLSAAALSVKEHFTVLGITPGVPVAAYLLSAAAVAWGAFYVMDRCWYHRLLIGAVRHGEAIEAKWAKDFPEMCLTRTISEQSAIHLWSWLTPWRKTRVQFRSTARVDTFYAIGAVLLAAAMVVACTMGGDSAAKDISTSPNAEVCECPAEPESDPEVVIKR